MSKLKQRYLKEVKSFFPIMGKPERRHLKKLSEQINDYCLEKEVFSIEIYIRTSDVQVKFPIPIFQILISMILLKEYNFPNG